MKKDGKQERKGTGRMSKIEVDGVEREKQEETMHSRRGGRGAGSDGSEAFIANKMHSKTLQLQAGDQ